MDGATTQGRARGFRVVASLIVVLVAAGVCAGAFAPWSDASAALPRSLFSSGSLAVAGGSVVMDASGLAPGGSVTGAVVVVNEGDAPGRLALRTRVLVDTTGAAGGSLAQALRLTVTDVTDHGAGRCVYDGPLAGLASVDLGSCAPGAVRAYRFTVVFAAQDADAAAFAGSTVNVAFDWTAVTTG